MVKEAGRGFGREESCRAWCLVNFMERSTREVSGRFGELRVIFGVKGEGKELGYLYFYF